MGKLSFNKKWNFAVKNKNAANSRLDFLRKKNETTNYGMNRNSKSTLRKKVCNVPFIIQLQKWKQPKVLQGAEDFNEKSDEFVEIPEDSKNTINNATNGNSEKKKSRLSVDFAKMFLVIGSLEEPIKENINSTLFSQDDKETFSNNGTKFKSISTNLNFQLEKNDFADNKNKLTYVNHINVNIMNDTSRMNNSVQILALNETTGEKVLNPHLGKEKSYFLYKTTRRDVKVD
ncbi:uncharacterized protein LOC122507473 [Leptopilina heterotoma]|uniref:uncharacterized protein LOC122507473 n=1 Tax=Leptopilina heterotoma TaxID=63436 RepID=UPI001CA93775|nr:uncharacterized protein LOC122507473 [Leptopilina heterotoma]